MRPNLLNRSISFVSNAVQRRLNADEFIQVDQTPYQVIYKKDLMSLRYYHPLREKSIEIEGEQILVAKHQHHIPILLVPPLGVYAWVFDLLVKRSFVRFLLAHGHRVYLVDWGEPGKSDAHLSLTNYVIDWLPNAIKHVRKHAFSENTHTEDSTDSDLNQPITLLGYCMGGLLSLLYAATSDDEDVANIITIASPIDFHEQDLIGKFSAVVKKPLELAQRYVNPKHIKHLRQRFFHVKGKSVSKAFWLADPLGSFKSYISLVRNMADREYVIAYMSISQWFTNMTDFPGATLEEMMHKFSIQNQLANGSVKIGSIIADFSTIKSRLLAIAGDSDTIVSTKAAEKILDIISSTDKSFKVAPGGHAGVFGGRLSCVTTWQLCTNWLERRSI